MPTRRLLCSAWLLSISMLLSPTIMPALGQGRGTPTTPPPATTTTDTATMAKRLGLTQWTAQRLILPGYAERSAGQWTLAVVLGERTVTLRLRPRSLRAPGYQLAIDDGPGARPLPALPPEDNHAGTVDGFPGSLVALSVVNGLPRITIELGEQKPEDGGDASGATVVRRGVVPRPPATGPTMWFVQSAREAGDDLPDLAFAYPSNGVKPHGFRCAGAVSPENLIAEAEPDGPGTGGGTCNRLAQIAFDADFPFYQQNGSSIANTEADITAIVNAMNVIYARDTNVLFTVTRIVVRTADSTTLYNTADISILLNQIRNEWNANQTATVRDLTHLMTGRPTGGAIGIAYLGVVCTTSAYGVSQSRFTDNLASRVGLTAHEVGHNFSAQHCDGDSDCLIMCAFLGGCSGDVTRFGTRSVGSIRNHAFSRTCMSVTGGFVNAVPPRAVSDSSTGTGNVAITVDVLANDTDGNCNTLTISSFDTTTPSGAVVTRIVGNGPGGRDTLRWTPGPNAAGVDQFNYTITDGTATSTAAVRMNLTRNRTPETLGPVQPGLDVAFYRHDAPGQLPDFGPLTPLSGQTVPQVNFPSTEGNFAGSGRADNVAATFTGTIAIPVSGTWTFFMESDDGSQLYINNRLVVDNDGVHGMLERSGTISLPAGPAAFRVEFFEAGSGAGVIARWQGPSGSGFAKQIIPASAFSPGLLTATYYPMLTSEATVLPTNFGQRIPYLRSSVADINIPSNEATILDSLRADDVVSVFTGWLLAPLTGTYTLITESDDGSKLFIGSSLVVNNDGQHGMQVAQGTIGLTAGAHPIRVEWFDSGGPHGLIVRYIGPTNSGIVEQVIPNAQFRRPLPPPTACSPADVVAVGGNPPPDGILTGDDFNAFIGAFAAGNLLADIVAIGGVQPPDGLLTGDDFNAFIAAFAAGCP